MAERREEEDYDSDAPEEFTAEQGLKQDEELTKVAKENKARISRERKEKRRLLAEKLTQQKSSKRKSSKVKTSKEKTAKDSADSEDEYEDMLPSDIVNILAEKKVFASDDEEENAEGKSKKKKRKSFGPNIILLNDTQPPECLHKSLDFLKKKKMQVARSTAVLNNSNKAFRLLSHSGL
ncbi:hypothetical protein ACFE04_001337 [Oxalis oulophora]